jgi:hypothetical protein
MIIYLLSGGGTKAKPSTFAPRFKGTVLGKLDRRSQHVSGVLKGRKRGFKETKKSFGETK